MGPAVHVALPMPKTPAKRIHNPKTGKYYAIRQRTTKAGKKGTIKGLWKKKP